ncbi:cell division cycle protein [Trichophyton mentagrophytes]|uniref:Uncharacterized protein n=1 Tax=Trichophyton interdigitale (strain MR816) TaxID=1215338 RepID=A0A059J5G8_TRIIM|nr:hypothetical protein H101_01298 [Trichophyton interdigitale H6]KDB23100.1 hypothetical protein H109_04998 [Trichophyton interdigitale MR816]GBF66587.1 cell division cycle protein [Trichophyton mentagrophytes]
MVDVHEDDGVPSSPPSLNATEDTLPSSPPPMKPKKKPPVTPRSFRRFFTPRSSLNAPNTRSRAIRNALQEITSSPALNRLGPAFPGVPDSSDCAIASSSPCQDPFRTPSKKRKLSFCGLSSPPLQSSPLRRVRIAPPIFDDAPSPKRGNIFAPADEIAGPEAEEPVETLQMPAPLRRSKVLGQMSSSLHVRSFGLSRRSRTTIRASSGTNWQDETSSFYSKSEDSHACWKGEYPVTPYCTASCNTNSLVAVGDEAGGIRLLDTSPDVENGFSSAYLSFPSMHKNSIMDLEFSSDDKLLATASGDQTSHIIDMTTQTPIYSLSKHTCSVKRVQFQPGSNNNVVATCSRDGSVNIWDLRYKAYDKPAFRLQCSLGDDDDDTLRPPAKMKYAQTSKTITGAHLERARTKSEQESQLRRDDTTVTSVSFLNPGREHLFVTSSESNACVRLWDLRTAYTLRRAAVPLASTRQPDSHSRFRQFGLTSLTFNTDGSRLYTLCRDGTIYAYSTPHLLLGNSPEMSQPNNTPGRRYPAEEAKAGLGPLYGFRHPRLMVGSFFVKIGLRRAADDKTELLSVGSSDNCAILFPTDERYLTPALASSTNQPPSTTPTTNTSLPPIQSTAEHRLRPCLRRSNSSSSLSDRLEHTIPIYQHGTALVEGHNKEVTAVSWAHGGELVTVSDDLHARCWREGPAARKLRRDGDINGQRWQCGWADVKDPSYDDDDA